MPLCKPVIATVGLYYAVGQWNSFMDTYLYAKKLPTLQYKLYEIMNQATMKMDVHAGTCTDGRNTNVRTYGRNDCSNCADRYCISVPSEILYRRYDTWFC